MNKKFIPTRFVTDVFEYIPVKVGDGGYWMSENGHFYEGWEAEPIGDVPEFVIPYSWYEVKSGVVQAGDYAKVYSSFEKYMPIEDGYIGEDVNLYFHSVARKK